MAELVFERVGKRFGRGPDILRGIDLTIGHGEFCVFIGPSGSGKSTLLRMVAGLEEISHGELRIDGVRANELAPVERKVAMVFQGYALYPHMTVYDNMAFGLKGAGDRAAIARKVTEAAELLRLTPLLSRLPRELSGGQRQRVAIGRAIVRQPRVFLFDEPLSNLDAELRVQMRIEIARLHADNRDATMVYVTHDQVEAMTLADKIVLLNPGDAAQDAGSIAQVGAPLDLYRHPANRFVAGFIGSPRMNFLPARLTAAEPGLLRAQAGTLPFTARVDATGLPAGAPLTLGIRPEHARIVGPAAAGAAAANTLHGEVAFVEQLGDMAIVYLRLGGEQLFAVRAAGAAAPHKGERLAVACDPDWMYAFDSADRALPRTA